MALKSRLFRNATSLVIPGIRVGVAVAEVVHVHAVLLQAAGALLDARQEASPVAPPLSFPVQPPGHRTAVCNKVFPLVSNGNGGASCIWLVHLPKP